MVLSTKGLSYSCREIGKDPRYGGSGALRDRSLASKLIKRRILEQKQSDQQDRRTEGVTSTYFPATTFLSPLVGKISSFRTVLENSGRAATVRSECKASSILWQLCSTLAYGWTGKGPLRRGSCLEKSSKVPSWAVHPRQIRSKRQPSHILRE